MSRKARSCELEQIDLSEDCYSEIITFLDTFKVTALEAQIIWEVANYRQHHIDLNMLSKKIPKEFKLPNIEGSVKELINNGFLKPYEAKKEVRCVRCTAWGRDVAYLIRDNCYSEKLRYFDALSEKYAEAKCLLCFDPQGFEVGEKRYARGPKDEKVVLLIKKKYRGDRIFRYAEDGTPIYEIKLEVEIVGCPRCNGKILMEFCYNPNSCYKEFEHVNCINCGFEFMLRYALDVFYY